jgi:hypothetical protein
MGSAVYCQQEHRKLGRIRWKFVTITLNVAKRRTISYTEELRKASIKTAEVMHVREVEPETL